MEVLVQGQLSALASYTRRDNTFPEQELRGLGKSISPASVSHPCAIIYQRSSMKRDLKIMAKGCVKRALALFQTKE